jgi:hypothetical protein
MVRCAARGQGNEPARVGQDGGDSAAAHAFDEIPGRAELAARWATAHARWHQVLSREAELLPERLHNLADGPRRPDSTAWRV